MKSRLKLPQFITYWTPTGNNGTGGKTWAAGVKIKARIADTNEEVFTADGKIQHARKAVYSKTDIPLGSYIVEGAHSGTTTPTSDAQLVIKASSNSTMTDMNRVLL